MKTPPDRRLLTRSCFFLVVMAGSSPAWAQVANPVPASRPMSPAIEKINADYRSEVQKLERRRLAQLGDLAARQPKEEAEATYHDYFQLAVAKGLYAEAEPVSVQLLASGDAPADLRTMASLVKIVAEADRGAFDESLKSLNEAVSEKARQAKPPGGQGLGLSASSKAAIVEAYYQRMVRGHQYPVALKAMQIVAENAEIPAVRDLAARRAKQLAMIGVAAPPIVGKDLDGKPFRLEDAKGDVVLVVFWATWCLPAAQEIPWLEEAYKTYRDRGFRIVGINVDTAQDPNADPASFVPDVRRFLIEFNITWPTLINGKGEEDWTRAYSIGEIPASVLIGRDGKVIHLDLTGQKLGEAVGEAIGQKP